MKIYVEPEEAWEYYIDNTPDLREGLHILAEDEEKGISVGLTVDEYDCPDFLVTVNGEEEYEEYAISESDTRKTLSKIYQEYFPGTEVETDEEEDEDEVNREEEIEDALDIFLSEISDDPVTPDEFGEIKEHILAFLAKKIGLRIYRPMVIKDDKDGKEYEVDYPYEV